NREGVALNKELNVEALFVTLKKSEKEYSPTTLYDDYAINEYLFHWQSQNATAPESPKGQSYINHQETHKKILLFVREQNDDEYGFTMGYVFIGEADFIKSTGARPMNIEWKLKEPMPAYIWKESGKLAVG
ncbi:MAG: restriction endonuclease subunit, partial [Daejeonella sp.]|nr:restriction endonuclease subunit [Daejeonella sp.]